MSKSRQNLGVFLNNKLADETDTTVQWVDVKTGKFRIRWIHAGRPDWKENHDAELFKQWCHFNNKSNGKILNLTVSDMKARFRNAINKSKYISKMEKPDEDDSYLYYQFIENQASVQETAEDVPPNTPFNDSVIPETVTAMDVESVQMETELVDENGQSFTVLTEPMNDINHAGNYTAAPQQEHMCRYPNMELEISYKGVSVKRELLINSLYRIYDGSNDDLGELTQEQKYVIFGPSDAENICLPALPEGADIIDTLVIPKIEKILGGMERGLILYYENNTGDIFAYRLCRTSIFFTGIGCATEVTSIPRQNLTKVFCFKTFKESLMNYQRQQGSRPSPLVYLSFGQKWNSHWQIEKTVVSAVVTHYIAKAAVDDLSSKMNGSLEFSAPDSNDQLLLANKLKGFCEQTSGNFSEDWAWLLNDVGTSSIANPNLLA